MARSSTEKSISLPIRIVPERESIIDSIEWGAFALFFLVLGILTIRGFILDPGPKLVERMGHGGSSALGCLMVLIIGAGFLLMLRQSIRALLASFPNSPFYYTEISPDGIAVRDGWRGPKLFRWTDLSRFSVAVRVITSSDGDKDKERWVVAQAGANTVIPEDKKLSYLRAAIRIDPKCYAAGAPALVNKEFADWLNIIRDEALAGGILEVKVPPFLRESILPTPFADAPGRADMAER